VFALHALNPANFDDEDMVASVAAVEVEQTVQTVQTVQTKIVNANTDTPPRTNQENQSQLQPPEPNGQEQLGQPAPNDNIVGNVPVQTGAVPPKTQSNQNNSTQPPPQTTQRNVSKNQPPSETLNWNDIFQHFPPNNAVTEKVVINTPQTPQSRPPAVPTVEPFSSGDVNGDGIICMNDATEILSWLSGSQKSILFDDPRAWDAALILSDEAPTINDAIAIVSYAVGIPNAIGVNLGGHCDCCCEQCNYVFEDKWGIGNVPWTVNSMICRCFKGDVNGDGVVNIHDALEILKYVSGVDTLIRARNDNDNPSIWLNAQVTANSRETDEITVFDAIEILKYIAGMDSELKSTS
jgi:hypothetical protein